VCFLASLFLSAGVFSRDNPTETKGIQSGDCSILGAPHERILSGSSAKVESGTHITAMGGSHKHRQCDNDAGRRSVMQTASVKWVGQQQFTATSPSGHTVKVDSDRESNTAPGPMEMVLLALGACTATDIVIILEKKRQKLESLEVVCSGERATDPPQVWIKLELLFRLRGAVDEGAVKHAIELSKEKYCSVAAMLKKTAQIAWRHEILPPA
jgi:putative redox protein